MDDRSFDRMTRALGGASTRRGALAALLGLGAAAGAARGAGARKKCRPKCPAGQRCEQGTCVCTNGGAVCGASCCPLGQRCENGQCVAEPAPCLAAGERCKDTGRICCDGTVCASGQGGTGDIACYVPAGGACERSAECVFGSACQQGTCVADQPPPEPLNCAVCASGCPFTTIEAAVAAASYGNEIITIAAGVYRPAVSSGSRAAKWTGYLELPRPVTLQPCGNGAVVIDCPPSSIASCILATHQTGTVALDGLTLRGGNTTDIDPRFGVAVFNSSGDLTIRNCTVSGFSNGVWFSSTGTLTVDGGSFTGIGTGFTAGLQISGPNLAVCPNRPELDAFPVRCSPLNLFGVGCGCAG